MITSVARQAESVAASAYAACYARNATLGWECSETLPCCSCEQFVISEAILKLVAISDTHNHWPSSLPDGDILCHAGDLTQSGKLKELASAVQHLKDQVGRFKHVVCTGGNHDFALAAFMNQGEEEMLRRDFFGDVIYLRDNACALMNRKFYGSPWTLKSQQSDNVWAFQGKPWELRDKFSEIPDNVDVLITHSPPYGVLDHYWQWRLGSEDLMERVKVIRPKLHIFGHVHNAYGNVIRDGTWFFNACSTEVINDSYVLREQGFWEIDLG